MNREVFVQADGETFMVWDVEFSHVERGRQTMPCTYYERDGTFRKGQMTRVLESAQVTFCAVAGSLHIGQDGQMSSAGDQFYEVTITSCEPRQDHTRVRGRATRTISLEKDK